MLEEQNSTLIPEVKDHCFKKDFKYTHNNPYHDRLSDFDHFVLRDDEGETLKGKWRSDIFQNDLPLHVEVGSGYGHFMTQFLTRYPNVNFVGMDYRFKRSFQLAKKLETYSHLNLRYLRAKGERIHFLFNKNEVDALHYYFPDPWPKTRHHKKRLFNIPFLSALYQVIKPGGKVYVKTDHDGYFSWMLEKLEESGLFQINLLTWDLKEENPTHKLAQFETKFEKIFLKQGIKIKALELTPKKESI